MNWGDRGTVIKLAWLLPNLLQPRFIRIMYARYWLWWINESHPSYSIELRHHYIKALCEDSDMLDIRNR